MQVLCKSTSATPEMCCSVCGQGFVLFWERQTKSERAHTMREIAKALRGHHHDVSGREAHPRRGFIVPDANGPAEFSGAATLGNAPSWAL
jgi:hypothetical protein